MTNLKNLTKPSTLALVVVLAITVLMAIYGGYAHHIGKTSIFYVRSTGFYHGFVVFCHVFFIIYGFVLMAAVLRYSLKFFDWLFTKADKEWDETR